MAKYQRIEAAKKRRIEIIFQTEKPCQLSSSVQPLDPPPPAQKEKDQMHGTLDNISSLSQVHHVTKEIIPVFEITSTPTSTMTDVSMRDTDCLQAECQLLKHENRLLKEAFGRQGFTKFWFESDDSKVKFYTEPPSFQILMTLFNFIVMSVACTPGPACLYCHIL